MLGLTTFLVRSNTVCDHLIMILKVWPAPITFANEYMNDHNLTAC